MIPRLLNHDGKISGLAIRTVMDQWAVTEPVAALHWALDMLDSGRTAFDPAIGVGARLFRQWAQSAPQAALNELSRRAVAQPRLAANGMWDIMGAKDSRHVFLDRIGPESSDAERAQVMSLGRLALQWARPEYRKPLVDQLSIAPALQKELLKDL